MMFCAKHFCFYYGVKCKKCINGEPPYLRTRKEVADPDEWRRCKRMGWIKND